MVGPAPPRDLIYYPTSAFGHVGVEKRPDVIATDDIFLVDEDEFDVRPPLRQGNGGKTAGEAGATDDDAGHVLRPKGRYR